MTDGGRDNVKGGVIRSLCCRATKNATGKDFAILHGRLSSSTLELPYHRYHTNKI